MGADSSARVALRSVVGVCGSAVGEGVGSRCEDRKLGSSEVGLEWELGGVRSRSVGRVELAQGSLGRSEKSFSRVELALWLELAL